MLDLQYLTFAKKSNNKLICRKGKYNVCNQYNIRTNRCDY